MNRFSKYISSQFKNPRGIGGVIISIIQNVINRAMYKNAVLKQAGFERIELKEIISGKSYVVIYKK